MSKADQKPAHKPRFHGISEEKLLDELSYYGAYHQNFWNQILHFLTVPLIQWSFVIFLHAFTPVWSNDLLDKLGLQLHLGTFAVFFYILYYFRMGELFVTGTYNIIQLALLIHANYFIAAHMDNAFFWFVATQIVGWGLQIFIGHLTFEGRNPTFTDSSVDAALLAPLFTWWEVLWMCGYDLEFKERLQVEIDKKMVLLKAGQSIAPGKMKKAAKAT